MLDIKFIRENKDLVKEAARKKHIDVDIDELLKVDDGRRELLTSVEKKRAEQNVVSDTISKGVTDRERNTLIEKMRILKEELQAEEEKLKKSISVWREIMLQVPNVPDMSVPEGGSDVNNKEVKVWGEKPTFSFTPKSHVDIMTVLEAFTKMREAVPDPLTPIEKIRREIEEELGIQQEASYYVPTTAFVALLFKALLLERSRFQNEPGDWDIKLGERLLKIDPSPETLELIMGLFEGTFLGVNAKTTLR